MCVCQSGLCARVSVCTTTLWLGHLPKNTSEEELRKEIEKHGDVGSINVSLGATDVSRAAMFVLQFLAGKHNKPVPESLGLGFMFIS